MKLIFKGKVAVVTGGSGGIGLDVSKKLAKLKIKVLILDINKPNIIKNKFFIIFSYLVLRKTLQP